MLDPNPIAPIVHYTVLYPVLLASAQQFLCYLLRTVHTGRLIENVRLNFESANGTSDWNLILCVQLYASNYMTFVGLNQVLLETHFLKENHILAFAVFYFCHAISFLEIHQVSLNQIYFFLVEELYLLLAFVYYRYILHDSTRHTFRPTLIYVSFIPVLVPCRISSVVAGGGNALNLALLDHILVD